VVDVLTWVMERRLVLADRAKRLREELAELDAEAARLEAAEPEQLVYQCPLQLGCQSGRVHASPRRSMDLRALR
jgi:hypothetical protein